jgi:hypothetical protein
VKLRVPELAFLFTLGAAASLVGDHSHVATGTTEYLTGAVPFVWSSPIWFPLLVAVAVATVSLAELRLRCEKYPNQLPLPWPTLAYGQTGSLGVITCTSEPFGITCTNTATSHFFRLSNESYDVG